MFPYKGWAVSNFVFNMLGATFGAFSFFALSPILGILFGTQEPITDPVPFSLSFNSLKHNLFYYMSGIMEESGQMKTLYFIGVFMILMTLLKVGFTYVASYCTVPIRNGVVRDLRTKIYAKLLKLPVGYFSDEKKGNIISTISSDVIEVENSIMNSVEILFKNPMLIIIYLMMMIYMSWKLTLFVFFMLPIAGFVTGRIGRSLKKPSRKGQDKMGEVLSTVEETLSGLEIIKSFTAESQMTERFGHELNDYRKIMNRLMGRSFLAHPVSEFLGTVIIMVVLWYGGSLILSGNGILSPEDFITYLVFFYSIINPVKAFSSAWYSVEKGLASVDRIDKVLLAPDVIVDKSTSLKKTKFEHQIEFRNVSFGYRVDTILHDINLTIPFGKNVALVGKSGSGKTTFVKLLPRFWDIEHGEILIDGVNVKDIKLKELREMMGYVSQEPILFNDTFENNIALGKKSVDHEAVVAAAKVANAHEFIMESEGEYQGNIGDRGCKLSGGQKQRLSIARAVLKNPPILILDEATSALDTESERLVQDALDKLTQNRTSIVIAHRLSTIKNADMICVFKKGRIVETGTHEELLALQGEYYNLHKLQAF